jgi:hypothetical protein
VQEKSIGFITMKRKRREKRLKFITEFARDILCSSNLKLDSNNKKYSIPDRKIK